MTQFGFSAAQSPTEAWVAFRDFLRVWAGRPDYTFDIRTEPEDRVGRHLPATVLTWGQFAKTVRQLDPPFGFRDHAEFSDNRVRRQFDLILQAEGDIAWGILDEHLDREQPPITMQVFTYDGDWDDPSAWRRVEFAEDVITATLRYLQTYLESLGGSFERDEPLTTTERDRLVTWARPDRLGQIELFHRPEMLVIGQPHDPHVAAPGLQIEFGPEVDRDAIRASPLGDLMRTCRVRFNPLRLPVRDDGG